MKKFYSFIIAAMTAVTMCAETIQQDIALTPGDWGWGYNCSVTAVEGGLQAQLTGDWGALSTGWDPEIDLSGWDKIIILVDRMDGCVGQWFQLKAYLRDHADNEGCQMEGLLNDADGSQQQYLVIDLKQEKSGFDLTKARVLAIQCQPNGAKFLISRVYLEKEEEATAIEQVTLRNNGIRYNLLGQPVGEDYKGIVILNGHKMIVR